MKNLLFLVLLLFVVKTGFSQGPGGVSLGSNNLWVSADYGVTLDASNGVEVWENRMGIANLDMIGVGANKPTLVDADINGLPTIHFDGTGLLESSGYLSPAYFPTSDATVFIITRTEVLDKNTNTYGTYPLEASRFNAHLSWGDARFYFDIGLCCDPRIKGTYSSVGAVVDTYYLWGFAANSAAPLLEGFLDGARVRQATGDGNFVFANHAIKKFQFGGAGEATTGFLGDIAEFILYNEDINVAQRIIINNYLSAKYNLGITSDFYADAVYTFDVIGIGTTNGTIKHAASVNGSSGLGLAESNTTLNASNEYVFAGHNNTVNAVVETNLGVGVEERWEKDWSIDKTGTVDTQISFDFSEGINGLYPQNSDDYLLLRLNGGTYDNVGIANGNKSISGDKIIFDVANVDLIDGVYTLGTADKAASPVFGKSLRTWYSYQSGNWADPTTWTLDGTGADLTNPGSETPTADDIAVILSGRTVTIQAGTNNINISEFEVEGTLNLTSSTGHNFNKIAGNGVITTSAAVDNFPDGDASNFSNTAIGGKMVYNGTGITLDTDREFNNIEVNLTNTTDVVTMVSNYDVNGTFTITNGTFQINDNSNTAQLNLSVVDLIVEANGNITVGTASTIGTFSIGSNNLPTVGNYHAIYHRLNITGDFTNNGSVILTNQAVPDYSELYSGGAVTVYFKGNTSNVTTLNGHTDFYNLVVDKGSNQSYIVEINSAVTANFELFGPNYATWNAASPFTTENPEIRKALWVKNGTLKLTGNLNIPTLTEGAQSADRDYLIPQNGALWIDGAGVSVRGTAITSDTDVAGHVGVTDNYGWKSLLLYGKFRISNGSFSTGNANGGIAFGPAAFPEIIIEGGQVTCSQLKQSGVANAAYNQSGGSLLLTGQDSNGDFNLDNSGTVFTMSGGELILNEGSFLVSSTPGNYNVTGGKVIFNMSANPIISSTANLWDIELKTQSGAHTLTLDNDLIVSNDLIIEANTTLNTSGSNYNLTIGADITIDAAGAYTANNNTTTLNGTKISNLDFGALVTFNNLTINKDDASQLVEIDNGLATAIQINGAFSHEAGTFDYKTFDISALGSVNIEDTLGVAGQTGQLVLNGASQQSFTSVNGVVANMEIDNSNGIDLLSGDLSIFETLTMTTGIFDINTSKLTMTGANASIIGAFSSTLMIQTAGNASDGGLEMYVDANETLTYPIGTDANAVVRYTPVTATFSSYADDGYVSISISDTQLPTTNASGGEILSYYWKVKHAGFTTLPKVTSYVFTHDASDEDAATGTSSWVPGFVWDDSPYTRDTEKQTNYSGTNITFNGKLDNTATPFDLVMASYTVGAPPRFTGTIDLYYSRISYIGSGKYGNFNDASTWSKAEQDGTGTQEVPGEGSIIIIQKEDRVSVRAPIPTLGRVEFDHDYVVYPIPDSENVSRLQFMEPATFELGAVIGTGMISFDATDAPVVNGDFGDFGTNPDSYYLYFGGSAATLANMPTPIPNMMMEDGTYSVNQSILVNYDLIVQFGTITPLQDMQIGNDLIIGYWPGAAANFVFPSAGSAVSVTVDRNIDFTVDPNNNLTERNLLVGDSGTDLEHTLIVKGDIIHGTENNHRIDLYNASETRPRVVLEFQGETDNNYDRSSTSVPDLFRVVLNKGTTQANSFTFNNRFTLAGSTNGATKALELQNGTLVLNDAAIDIDLTTGGNDFQISATTVLQITQGTVNASGDDSGIWLDGSLIIDGGTVDMDDTGNNGNNYIEYSASGNATIDISAGALTVGSQIRRHTTINSGVLNYTQTGGTVVIGKNAAPDANRGVFEVLNTGSNMTLTGGDFTLVRQNGASPSIAALYLEPETSDFTGSTITLGNADTPASQSEFNITSVPAINNLTLAGIDSPVTKLKVYELIVNGDLTVNAGTKLDGNHLDLTLIGDFTNNGTYEGGTGNTTYFSGTGTQTYAGSGVDRFNNFTKTNSSTLLLNKSVFVIGQLTLSSGALNTNTYTVTCRRHAEIDIDVTSTSGFGIYFKGLNPQILSRSVAGESSIDILTIFNPLGVEIPSGTAYNFIIGKQLRLHKGKFSVGSNLLTISATGSIVPSNPFSDTNMIQTNSSFTDNGVKKEFPAISSATNFTFPVGETIYTPVVFAITNMDAGSITARPANEMHVSIVEDVEAPNTEIVDADNALQYHWVINSADILSMTASATFTYDAAHVVANNGYTAANYIPARLLDATTAWDKAFSTTDFDEGSNTFTVGFAGVDNNGIKGVYTAGVGVDNSDVGINGAIPDNIPTYETNSAGGGDYDIGATWIEAIPLNGPIGGQITVKTGDDLILNNDGVRLSRTIIETGGTLTVDETTFHRLGTVTGTGTLKIVSSGINANLPAGFYDDFFSCTGGSLEYAGTGNYSIMPSLASVRNLTLSGTGNRDLANNDVSVCEDLTLNGPVFNNSNNRDVSIVDELIISAGTFNSGTGSVAINGDMTVNGGTLDNQTGGLLDVSGALAISAGTFNAGTGGAVYLRGDVNFTGGTFTGGATTATLRFNGATLQTVAGDFTGANSFYRVEMFNDVGLSNNIEIDNQLTFASGIMEANSNTVTLGAAITVSPEEGLSTSYIDGKVEKILTSSGDNFTFPIGKNGRWGYASVNNVSSGGETWDAEYFYASPTTHAIVDNLTPADASIETISNSEYWVITDGGAAPGVTATIGLSWDGGSDVSANSAERQKLEVMAWNDGASTWDEYGGDVFSGGHTQSAGSFQSATAITFSQNILTLGSTDLANALPVELLSFNAEELNRTVKLTWETASELNNDYFTLLRSKDGENFESVATILGAGTSAKVLAYSFVDERPFNGISYYKLIQTDFDGTTVDAGVILIRLVHNVAELELHTYPNPFNNQGVSFILSGLNKEEVVSVMVIDAFGRRYYMNDQQATEAGYLDFTITEVNNWGAGVYIVRVLAEKGVIQTKILKQ